MGKALPIKKYSLSFPFAFPFGNPIFLLQFPILWTSSDVHSLHFLYLFLSWTEFNSVFHTYNFPYKWSCYNFCLKTLNSIHTLWEWQYQWFKKILQIISLRQMVVTCFSVCIVKHDSTSGMQLEYPPTTSDFF